MIIQRQQTHNLEYCVSLKYVATLDSEDAQDLVVPRNPHKDELICGVRPSSKVDDSAHNSESTLVLLVVHASTTTLVAGKYEDCGSILLTGLYAISH